MDLVSFEFSDGQLFYLLLQEQLELALFPKRVFRATSLTQKCGLSESLFVILVKLWSSRNSPVFEFTRVLVRGYSTHKPESTLFLDRESP